MELPYEQRKLNPQGHSQHRGLAGGLQWVVTQGRPDRLGKTLHVQSKLAAPVVEDLKMAAKVVDEPLAEPEVEIRMSPVDLKDMLYVVFLRRKFW